MHVYYVRMNTFLVMLMDLWICVCMFYVYKQWKIIALLLCVTVWSLLSSSQECERKVWDRICQHCGVRQVSRRNDGLQCGHGNPLLPGGIGYRNIQTRYENRLSGQVTWILAYHIQWTVTVIVQCINCFIWCRTLSIVTTVNQFLKMFTYMDFSDRTAPIHCRAWL